MTTHSKNAAIYLVLQTTFASLPNMAIGETFITCGGSFGKSFFFASPLLPEEVDKWEDDAISNGSIGLVGDGENLDIIMRDAVGIVSARASGAKVTLIDSQNNVATVLVDYTGGAKELYSFDFNRRQLAWSQHKFGHFFDKAGTFISKCD